jgi:adenosine kinase
LRVAVTGSIAFDYLMQFPGLFHEHILHEKLESISVSFLVDSLKKERGGCAANIAYTLALLGERPLLVGAAGRDFSEYGRSLEEAGVDTSGVLLAEDEYTSSFFANTDQKGNQICSFYTGAMRYAGDISIRKLPGGKIDLAVISPNDPAAMLKYAAECKQAGIPFIFDPGQQIVRLEGKDLVQAARGAKILIVNEYEREMFIKKTGLDQGGLLELSDALIVTKGEKGSEIHTQGKVISIPIAPPRKVLDPTGVGDAFRAGLIKGLSRSMPWEVSGRMGSLAATLVLETDGPQSHTTHLEAFMDRYESVFGKSEEIQKLRRPTPDGVPSAER